MFLFTEIPRTEKQKEVDLMVQNIAKLIQQQEDWLWNLRPMHGQ